MKAEQELIQVLEKLKSITGFNSVSEVESYIIRMDKKYFGHALVSEEAVNEWSSLKTTLKTLTVKYTELSEKIIKDKYGF